MAKVKTRLAKHTSDDFAYSVFNKLFTHTVTQFSDNKSFLSKMVLAQKEKIKVFNKQFVMPSDVQVPGDLGQKLNAAIKKEIENGLEKIIIIGTDCPFLNINDIRTAFSILENKDIVIGPTQDGGYYLLGVNASSFNEAIFENIKWSSSSVYEETINNLNLNNLSYTPLRELYDIDTKDDLERFKKEEKGAQLCQQLELE